MPEQTPQVNSIVVYELLQALRQDVRDQHSRLRQDMNAGFDRMAHESTGWREALAAHHGRLTAIETINSERKTLTQSHLSIIVTLISSSIFIAWELLRLFLLRNL